MKELVVDVHDQLQAIRQRAAATGESPVVIALIDQVLRLTDISNEEPEPALVQRASFRGPGGDPATCEHPRRDNFGRCIACGDCAHLSKKNGHCNTCGKIVAEDAA